MTIDSYATLKTALENWPDRSDAKWTDRIDEFIDLGEAQIAQDPDFRPRAMEASIDLVMQKAKINGTVSGTADAITLTLLSEDTITALVLGQTVEFKATATNTAAATLNVNGTGGTALRKNDGSADIGALEENDVIIGHTYQSYFDGTVWRLLPTPGAVPLPSRYHGVRRLYLDADPSSSLRWLPPEYFHTRFGSSSTSKPQFYTMENEYIVFGPQSDKARSAKLLYYRGIVPLDVVNTTNWFTNKAPHMILYKCLAVGYAKMDDDKNSLKYEAWYEGARDDVMRSDKLDRRGSTPTQRSVDVNVY